MFSIYSRSVFALLLLAVLSPLSVYAAGPPALTCPEATGREATLVLNLPAGTSLPMAEGWIVASTPSAACVGQASWHPELRTLTIHGDDPLTREADGAQPGEPITLQFFDAAGLTAEVELEATLDADACSTCSPDFAYAHDGLYVVKTLALKQSTSTGAGTLITEASVQALFPNPARTMATLQVALPAPEHVRITLYDVLGREVRQYHDDVFQAGVNRSQLQTAGLASGSYLLRVQGDSFQTTRSLVVID